MFISGKIKARAPSLSFVPSDADYLNFGKMALNLPLTYWLSACEEICGIATRHAPTMPDWKIDENVRAGKIPPTVVTSEDVTKFCRVWNFDRVPHDPHAPVFVIVAPNSGTAVQQMSEAALALLPYGNVRVVEPRDPHDVSAMYLNGLDDSTAALIRVLCLNPRAHLIGFSQSGNTATVACAYMYQNPQFKGLEPASLIVIGSPINAEIEPDSLNWMATLSHGEPAYIPVGFSYKGAGRLILPGTIPKLYFEKAPGESRAHMIAQALPAEHIHDTLTRVFREFRLPNEEYFFHGERIDTSAITCNVMTFAGALDRICPAAQTHDLHRLTPHARFRSQRTLENKGHYQLVGEEVLKRLIVPDVVATLRTKRRPKFISPAV